MFFAFRAMLRDPEAKVLAVAALAVIAIGSVVYMLFEHWSPDRRHLLLRGHPGHGRLWRPPPDDRRRPACSRSSTS